MFLFFQLEIKRTKDMKIGFFHTLPIPTGRDHVPSHTTGKCSSSMCALTNSSAQLEQDISLMPGFPSAVAQRKVSRRKEKWPINQAEGKLSSVTSECFNCGVLTAWVTGYFFPVATDCMEEHKFSSYLSSPTHAAIHPMLFTSYRALVFYGSLNLSNSEKPTVISGAV